MSAINEWTKWHLTPRGWERGSERTHDHIHRDLPDDRVLTVTFREYLAAANYKVQHWHDENWRSDAAGAVAALLEQYGPPPADL